MPETFIVLSEVPLTPGDAGRALEYLGLDPATGEDTPAVHAVVPADTERSLVAEVIDDLGLADLRGAFEAIRSRRSRTEETARAEADEVLSSVARSFTCVGCEVQGAVTQEDPLPAVRSLLEGCTTQTVVVFSDPQLLEEAFAQDWAHRVEDELGATVLHMYPGMTTIGTA